MSTITLVIIPGPGARTVQISENTTVATLVSNENLHGRDIIINGEGIAPNSFSTRLIPFGAEVFATASVKGNVKNTLSTSGRPNGSGRQNNPLSKR